MSDREDNVHKLEVVTKLAIPTDRVLEAAKNELPEVVVVIGYDDDGDLYFATSIPDGPRVAWLLEQGRQKLLELAQEDKQ